MRGGRGDASGLVGEGEGHEQEENSRSIFSFERRDWVEVALGDDVGAQRRAPPLRAKQQGGRLGADAG